MSRGPGRIERAIGDAFQQHPQRSYTTDELVALAYPEVRWIKKKHRVAVLRAARNVAPKYARTAVAMGMPGSPLLFVNEFDELAYLQGCTQAECPWWSKAEIASNIAAPGDYWVDRYRVYRQESEIARAVADGNQVRAAELRKDERRSKLAVALAQIRTWSL
jgi:hypothetical protein